MLARTAVRAAAPGLRRGFATEKEIAMRIAATKVRAIFFFFHPSHKEKET